MTVPRWLEAPMPTAAPASALAVAIGTVVVALAAPVAVAADRSATAAASVAAAGAVALALAALLRSHGWIVRAILWLAAGLVASVLAGPLAGTWLAVALALAWWVCLDRPPAPVLAPAGQGARTPVVVLSLAAATVALAGDHLWRAVALGVLACALPLVSRLGGGLLDRATHRVGAVVGGAVSAVCFTLLGMVVVVAPWAYQRAFRLDPLSPSTGWARRRRRDLQAEAPWTRDPALDPAPRALRLRRDGALLVAVAIVAMAIPTTRRVIVDAVAPRPKENKGFQLSVAPKQPTAQELPVLEDPVPEGIEASPHKEGTPFAAHANDPWFDQAAYNTGSAWGFDPRGAWRTIDPHRVLDFRSAWINVVDGHRVSWKPPACSCRRLRVWVYGGSTTFGLDQRDEHTIPSELARVAYEHGLVLDVSNRGLSGHLSWMEAEHLAWDLTQEEPPDLVVMYDGVNDVWSTATVNGTTGDTKPMVDPTSVDRWRHTKRSDGPVPKGPPGSRLLTPPASDPLPTLPYAKLVAKRYGESRRLSKNSAQVHGFPIRYFWQPTRVSRPLVLSEPHLDTNGENDYRLQEQVQVSLMPDDVYTMEDAFDGTTDALFVDDVHHNEQGARLVAEDMYGKLAPLLRQLDEKG